MDTEVLRIILITIGISVIIGIYLWDRFHTKAEDIYSDKNNDLNEEFEGVNLNDDVMVDSGLNNIVADRKQAELDRFPNISTEQDMPNNVDDQKDDSEKIIVISVVAEADERFNGEQLSQAFKEAGLVYGEMNIFHRMTEVDGKEESMFSVVNMIEPGYFISDGLEGTVTPGISFFLKLPGAKDGLEMFSDMLYTAQTVAEVLNGDLVDHSRSTMTKQTIDHLRDEILQFGLQGQMHPDKK
jgi:cell division protein ZipA